MKWDSDKLKMYLKIYNIRVKELADGIGLSKKTVEWMLYTSTRFEVYHHLLEAYFEGKRKSKIVEHETMIEFYKNFK